MPWTYGWISIVYSYLFFSLPPSNSNLIVPRCSSFCKWWRMKDMDRKARYWWPMREFLWTFLPYFGKSLQQSNVKQLPIYYRIVVSNLHQIMAVTVNHNCSSLYSRIWSFVWGRENSVPLVWCNNWCNFYHQKVALQHKKARKVWLVAFDIISMS